VNLASMSYIAGLGDAMPGFLDQEREILTGLFPEGRIIERFRTLLLASLVGADLDLNSAARP
jgi:hypothetical protein